MRRYLKPTVVFLVGLLGLLVPACVSWSGPMADPVIPGTKSPVATLSADLAWEFDLQQGRGTGYLTLDWERSGPPAEQVTSFHFRSKTPFTRDGSGTHYLRFTLQVYRFQSAKSASAALDAYQEWAQNKMLDGSLCKGARYWAQQGPFVYELSIGCRFSDDNYNLVVRRLEKALSKIEVEKGRALQCFCGGRSVERNLE